MFCRIPVALALALALAAPPVSLAGQDTLAQPEVVLLEFAWPAGLDAEVTVAQRMVRSGQGANSDVRISSRHRMTVSEHESGLLVAYSAGELLGFESDPPAPPDNPLLSLYRGLTSVESRFIVSPEGELVMVQGADQAAAAFRAAIGPIMDSVRAQPELATLVQSFESMVSADAMAAAAEEQWASMVWIWAGEEYEMGAVYELQSEEPSPLLPDMVVPMSYEMGFLEGTPCHDQDDGTGCVRLEVYSYPDPEAVQTLMEEFVRRMAPVLGGQLEFVEFEQENHIAVVVEPKTLVPHSYETSKSIRGVISENGEETAFTRLDSNLLTFRYSSAR